jgi:hypothetical protein
VAALGTVLFDSFGGGEDLGYLDNFSLSTVPEPATLALVGSSLLALGFQRRRRKQPPPEGPLGPWEISQATCSASQMSPRGVGPAFG